MFVYNFHPLYEAWEAEQDQAYLDWLDAVNDCPTDEESGPLELLYAQFQPEPEEEILF